MASTRLDMSPERVAEEIVGALAELPPAPALLGAAGESVAALLVWFRAEGGAGPQWGTPNRASHNPLNTTWRLSNSTTVNSAGVQSYPTWAEGIESTVATLRLPPYRAIVAAIVAGVSCAELARLVGESPWGTGNFGHLCPANATLTENVSHEAPVSPTSKQPPAPPASPKGTDTVQALVNPEDGKVHVYAVGTDPANAGHLLDIVPDAPGGPSVKDLTDVIVNAFPGSTPYTVAP